LTPSLQAAIIPDNLLEKYMRAVIIIPARLASIRLPRKALLKETGRYLVQHVYENARRSKKASDVIVATDSEEIADAVASFSGTAVLTSGKHESGTDRVAEAAANVDADVIVNVQGDEPEIDPDGIDMTIALLEKNAEASVSTLAAPLRDEREIHDPSKVKVVVDKRGFALYFSRSPIPFRREDGGLSPAKAEYLRHLGIYGYRKSYLLELARTPPCTLERAERLEQLRVLYCGAKIIVGVIPGAWPGIDTYEDYRDFIERMKAKNLCQSTSS
jgi:3-deoxy-manno-octulosonate cytidylyltransferase (CMP-KDO synthetase)